MKMKSLTLIMGLFFLLGIGYVSACDYDDTKNCDISKTIVKGVVYDLENSLPVGDAEVTVTCFHNGDTYSKETATINNNGILKGTYLVLFSQDECVAGDEVSVVAVKDNLNGVETGDVRDWIDRKCLDVDLAIIRVDMVPEFGIVLGAMTLLASIGTFFLIRKD